MSNHSYYAGFLDGEGCFTVAGGSPRVYVSNTHLPSLENLKRMYGGTVRQRDVAKGHSRECFEWYAYGQTAVDIAKILLPSLREKQAQAAILINWFYESRPAAKAGLNNMLKELKRL